VCIETLFDELMRLEEKNHGPAFFASEYGFMIIDDVYYMLILPLEDWKTFI